ncbi:ABC transporter permease [Paenibacillus pectinilyticus]|uniref:ABC transporter permease n=1 Tax=Paenibacillus pectinilyticus TaxID=512399 RepID=A0A1C0ZWX1_9BACL|nr:sugar ABC transporter permease [Paenibacillus pectinilyticus]OCT12590.1 ABC transporter permease [Paenibacillus pectinilyticus]
MAVEVVQQRNRTRAPKMNNEAYVFLLPAFALLTVFVIIPILYAANISVQDLNLYKKSAYVGFRNYYIILTDPFFTQSLVAGLKFAVDVVPAMFILAFLLAIIVKKMGKRSSSFAKSAIYVPTVISGIIASVIFMFIYSYQGGVLNYLIGIVGLDPVAWINDTKTAMWSIAIPGIWLWLGTTTLIMLAGLNDIPLEYYEAADMDGANAWVKMWNITIPSMRNVFIYLLITSINTAMQEFNIPFLVTEGGPLSLTTTPPLYIFNHFRHDPFLGQAIAAALIMFVLLGTISIVIFKLINSQQSLD